MRKLLTLLVALLAISAWAADESVTFSEQNYTNGVAVSPYTGSNFTITFDKGSNSNAPKYFSSGTAIRAYGGNTFTVASETKTITKIEITFGDSDGSNAITAGAGTYSNGTWTGSATSVTFTVGGSSGNRRLSTIAVTFQSTTPTTTTTYTKVTNISGIVSGDNYVIVYETTPAVSGDYTSDALESVSGSGITLSGNTLTVSSAASAVPVKITDSDGGYQLQQTNSDGYYLGLNSGKISGGSFSSDNEYVWAISFDNGNAVVQNKGNTYRYLRYSSSTGFVAATSSTGSPVQLYREGTTGDETPTPAAPTFSPAAGTYTSAQSVTISAATGTTIRYTIDGSDPTTSSSIYSSAIAVSETTTIKAIAVINGIFSPVASATYTIDTSSSGGGDGLTYEKVTSISSSDVGKKIIIVYETTPAAMGTISSDNYGQSITGTTNFTLSGSKITLTSNSDVAPLTLGGSSGAWTFAFADGKYMSWTSGNALTSATSISNNTKWAITFSNGVPTITNVADNTRKLQYNASSPRFACYTSSQKSVALYRQVSGTTTEQVATPTFSPTGGTYTEAQSVTINCATSGATIYYTTDGSTPTTSSATYSGAISVSSTTTIKVIAVKSGMTNSAVASATYTINSGGSDAGVYTLVTDASVLTAGDEIIIASAGAAGSAYAIANTTKADNRAATAVTISSGLTIKPTSTTEIFNLVGSSGEWSFQATGTTYNGEYLYASSSSANQLKYKTDITTAAQANITISNGSASVVFNDNNVRNVMRYNPNNGSPLFACYASSSSTGNLVYLYRKASNTVATPTFTPAAGTYTSAQNVTISCGTSGATIHYTTDGSTPTANSATYSSAIEVSSTTTIKAIAVKSGMTDSEVATATYTINLPQVATPTFSPAAGTYTSAQNVTISCTTSGATIYYTTDGTTPTANSATYSSAIAVSETATVKAIAVKSGMTDSEVASATYTINAPQVATPVISPSDGTVITGPTSVSISCATDGATIHYTTNGTTPTSSSATYSAAFTVSATTTVKAIAVKSGMTDSEVASATITYQAPVTSDEYTLVTDASTLASGDVVIIASNGAGEVMTAGKAGTSSTLAGSSTDVTFSSDKSTVTLGDGAEAVVLVLEGSSGAWTFRSGTNYMVASSSSNSVTMATTSATHTIAIGSNATATIKSGTDSRFLQYNSGANPTRFGSYESSFTGTNKEVQIYRQAAAASSVTTVTGIAAFKEVTAGETVRLYLPDSYNARVLHASQTASNPSAGTYTYDAYVRDSSGAMLIKGLVTTREMAHDQHIAGWLMGQYSTASDGNPQLTPDLCQSTDRTHCPWFVIADPVSETATEPVAVAATEVAGHAADWVKVSNVKVGTTSLTLNNAFNASYNVYNGALVDVSAIATPSAVYPVALGDEPVITHVVDATQAFVSPSSSISDAEVRLAKPFTAGVWTPLTVPFDITEFDGVIMEYIGVQQGDPVTAPSGRQFDAGNMIFEQATSIQAGVPYLVKAHDTTSGMTFSGVTLSNEPAGSVTHTVNVSSATYNAPRRVSSTDEYTMTGTYSPTSVSIADNSVKVMTDDGSVGWASALGGSVDGSSAYFTTPADQALRIVFDGDSSGTITGINDILAEGDTVAVDGTYNLMGVRMTSDWQSLPAGIYIVNGKKTVKQ